MKILLAGEGGQGVQLVTQLINKAAYLEKKPSLYIPNFGVEQRGGVSLAFVNIDPNVVYPKFEKADLLVIFSDRSYPRVKNYIGPKTKVFVGPTVSKNLVPNSQPVSGGKHSPKVYNIIILGKILKETNVVEMETIKKTMEERLAHHFKKNPKLRELDFEALEFGYGL